MLFNSITYLLFLPTVFLLYWALKDHRWQNALLVLASYVFYGMWDYRFLALIILSTFISFWVALQLEKGKHARRWLTTGLVINLGILFLFKYFDFCADNFQQLMLVIGVKVDAPTLHIILPVGISFYTFQVVGYMIDVYRGKAQPTRDLLAYTAYIAFFPQLVAGPIERSTHLLPQFQAPRKFSEYQGREGLRLILSGLFKKMVIADMCGTGCDMVFNQWVTYDALSLFLGSVLFAFQIYGDFSGYTDIAIGSAKLFGFELMQNFRTPYFSEDIPQFWRRWHISLTSWFRDYVYFPLGGSRCSKQRCLVNTLVVFGLSGLWHGADWTFVAWGLFHGILFTPYIFGWIKSQKNAELLPKPIPTIGSAFHMCLTFFLVCIGWIFFRASSLADAFGVIHSIFTFSTGHRAGFSGLTWLFLLLFVCAEWLQRDKPYWLQLPKSWPAALRWCLYLALILFIFTFSNNSGRFIYFQF